MVDACLTHECSYFQTLSCDLPLDILGTDCCMSHVDLNHVVDKRVVLAYDTTIVANHNDFVIPCFNSYLDVVDFVGCEKHLFSHVPRPKLLILHTSL